MLKEILIQVELNGDITYNYAKEYRVLTGYAVAMYPEEEMSMPILDEKNLIFFIHTNYNLLIQEENCLGIWYDKEIGIYVLDIVRVVNNIYEAQCIAWKNNQKAMFDLDKSETIYL